MNGKQAILTMLNDEFHRWEELLASLSEEQIATLRLPNGWTIKDVVAHLMAWQQVSISRLEAAKVNSAPAFPEWLRGGDPEAEEEKDTFNARIYESYKEQSWPQVHQAWREGFLSFLSLGEEIPEEELLDKDSFPWLKGYALLAVLEGSYEHHHLDHLEPLLAWLNKVSGSNGFSGV